MSKKERLLQSKRRFIINKFFNRGGFTLIEVIVGIVMFSIIMTTIFRLFAFSTIQNKRTNDLDELYTIAQRSMEYIKNEGAVSENFNYAELSNYTTDTDVLERFTVIYKADEIEIENPSGENDITSTLPSKVKNYNVNIEVFYTKDKDTLGPIGSASKAGAAKDNNVPIVLLNSQVIKYE